MAVLDRVKERAETDLSDAELEAIIADAEAAIVERFGLAGEEISVTRAGRRRSLDFPRPIDPEASLEVAEIAPGETTSTEVEPAGYRLVNGGRTLERVGRLWGFMVAVTYSPVDDSPQREEVAVKLALAAIAYEAVSSRSVGDVNTNNVDYAAEREAILAGLQPRRGLFVA